MGDKPVAVYHLYPLFDDRYFLLCQPVQLIHKSVDLLIRRVNLALDSRLRMAHLLRRQLLV